MVTVEAIGGRGVRTHSTLRSCSRSRRRGRRLFRWPVVVLGVGSFTPYLKALRQARRSEDLRDLPRPAARVRDQPAFFLDCADHFLRAGQREIGLRVLGDVLELQLEEPRLLRIAAHRLRQIGEVDLAIDLFEKVLRMRPESRSRFAISPWLSKPGPMTDEEGWPGEPGHHTRLRTQRGVAQQIVLGVWDGRFPEIEVIALEEANRIMALVERDPAFRTRGLPGRRPPAEVAGRGPAHRHDVGHRPHRHGPVGVTEPSGERVLLRARGRRSRAG